jgi:hypothetical protein
LLGTGNGKFGVNFDVDHRAENSPLEYHLAARATRFEGFSFYGFGNNTPKISSRAALVNQDLVAVEPLVMWNVGWRSREEPGGNLRPDSVGTRGLLPWFGKVQAGPTFYWTKASAPGNSPFAIVTGDNSEKFARAGARAGFELERVVRGAVPDRGVRLISELTAYPAILDVNKSFGTAQGAAMGYVPLGNGMHIGLRAGGAMATDAVPLLHAPAIGGRETVRGYSWQRFAGDRLAFGSAELRVPLGEVPVLVRWNVGAFGLVDAGRVWFDEEDNAGGWHKGVGGGLWFSSLGQTFSIAYARGSEGHLYLTKGMSF